MAYSQSASLKSPKDIQKTTPEPYLGCSFQKLLKESIKDNCKMTIFVRKFCKGYSRAKMAYFV